MNPPTLYRANHVSEDWDMRIGELHRDQPWQSPAEAQAHWSNREDLATPGVEAYDNGLQQTDDVHARVEFSALDVAVVWRRVTFQRMLGSTKPR